MQPETTRHKPEAEGTRNQKRTKNQKTRTEHQPNKKQKHPSISIYSNIHLLSNVVPAIFSNILSGYPALTKGRVQYWPSKCGLQ